MYSDSSSYEESDVGELYTSKHNELIIDVIKNIKDNNYTEAKKSVEKFNQIELNQTHVTNDYIKKYTIKNYELDQLSNELKEYNNDKVNCTQEVIQCNNTSDIIESIENEDDKLEFRIVEEIDETNKKHESLKNNQHNNWEQIKSNDKDTEWLIEYFSKEKWKIPKNAEIISYATTDNEAKYTVTKLNIDACENEDNYDKLEEDEFILNANKLNNLSHSRDAGLKLLKNIKKSKRTEKRLEKKNNKKLIKAQTAEQTANKLINITSEINKVVSILNKDDDYPSDQEWYKCDLCEHAIELGKKYFICSTCDYILCKRCKKIQTCEHEHELTKSICKNESPKGWELTESYVNKLKNDRIEVLANYIISKSTIKPDDNYKYIECKYDNKTDPYSKKSTNDLIETIFNDNDLK